jgi:UDP-N-acetylglucosamine--N-acetylmuramyl-(pentapeptide) pyrophosphoryl-undecaprenol N-acetylglucosamine transferase
MLVETKKILLTGGGTSGHVTPNIAIEERLIELGYTLEYIGRKTGIEYDLMKNIVSHYYGIHSGKFRRYFDLKNLFDLFSIFIGFTEAIYQLFNSKPDIIFSKGGFVTCPVVWAGWILKIPIIIHESDFSPGLANRLSIPFAKVICTTFKKFIKSRKTIFTGLPVRRIFQNGVRIEGKKICKFNDSSPVILIMGGSQGSQAINDIIINGLDKLLNHYQICHICGKGNIKGINRKGYYETEYAQESLPHFFAMASIIISRAGATTIFEILSVKKPNILIPLPLSASRGDQILNAKEFVRFGFSDVINQEELTSEILQDTIHKVLKEKNKYIENMNKSEIQDPTEKIMNVISTSMKM